MAQHGYLHDTYDKSDFGRDGDDRERSWRDDDRNFDWRSHDQDRDRRSGMMFRDVDRGRSSWGSHDDRQDSRDRGFFSRMRDDARSWFDDDDDNRRQAGRSSGSDGDEWFGGRERDFARESGPDRQRFSSHPDDHYRSWRDKQMQSLDRDYADYCREREQQFHSDFDAWRQQRQTNAQPQGNQEPLRTGMTQTSQTGDPTGALELSNEISDPATQETDPMGNATLGTNSSRRKG